MHEHRANPQRRCRVPECVEGACHPRQPVENNIGVETTTYVEPDNGLFAGTDASRDLFFGEMETCLVIC